MDGDEHTGFYRPIEQYAPGPVVTEAYSWGSLTSASRSLNQDGTSVGVRKDLQRALWMLLLPFAFANVAFWTRPPYSGARWGGTLGRGGGEAVGPRRVGRVVPAPALPGGDRDVRARRGRRRCRSGRMAVRDPAVPDKLPFLGFLEVKEAGGSWWSLGTRPLVVGLLAPVAAMLVLWWLARNSFQYEAEVAIREPGRCRAPDRPSDGEPLVLVGRRAGQAAGRTAPDIRPLVACAAAWLATFLIDQGRAGLDGRVTGAPSWYWGAATGVLLGVALLALFWRVGHRDVTRRDGKEGLGGVVWVLPLAAAACLAAVAYVLLPLRGVGDRGTGSLPGYGATITVLFIAEFVGVVLLAGHSRSGRLGVWLPLGAAAVAAWRRPGATPIPARPDGLRLDVAPDPGRTFMTVLVAVTAGVVTAVALPARGRAAELLGGVPRSLSRPAWGARGPAIIFGIGWLLAVIYSVGALYRLADWLNGRQAPTGRGRRLLGPGADLVLMGSAGRDAVRSGPCRATAGVGWVWVRRRAVQLRDEVEKRLSAAARRRPVEAEPARAAPGPRGRALAGLSRAGRAAVAGHPRRGSRCSPFPVPPSGSRARRPTSSRSSSSGS